MTTRPSRLAGAGLLAFALAAPGALALLPTAAPQKAAPEQKALPDKDLAKVAEQFAAYEKAKAENKGSFEVQEELEKELAKAAKKLGGDGKSFEAMLAHPWSMARALWLAADYKGKASKQRKEPGKVTDQAGPNDTPYSLWIPGKYKPESGPYPLMICIADEGIKPEQHIMEDWVAGEVRDNFVIASPVMPGNANEWLEPTGGLKAVMLTLKHVRENFAVDFDRVYIGGRGRGVETAHAIAARFPDQFAGVFGWGGDAHKDVAAENFRNIPVFFAGGGTHATAFQKAAEALKVTTVTLKQDGKAADIITWMNSVRRNPYPAEVSLLQKNGAPTNGYWLSIPRVDADRVAIDAKVDRATNTITIDAVGLDGATLLLNDAVVDMNKPVKVIANGVETVFSEGRKMSLSLELWMKGRNDGGRYFVATRDVRIPAKATEAAPAGGSAGGDAGQ